MLLDPVFNLSGKRIWVAGETGMVGQAVLRQLQSFDCQILSAPHANLDLTQQLETYNWLADHKPDVIVMAAAKVGGIGANAMEPAAFLHENLAMAQNVIHGAYQAQVKKLVYLGSSCIYPKYAEQPIKEEALLTGALEPTNEGYALAKIAGLKLCQFYRQQYGCDFIAAMPTNLYGLCDQFDLEKSHVIPAMILKFHQAKVNKESKVTLWGSGKPLREFLYADDLAKAIIHLLQYYSDDMALNIGSGEEVSIQQLAQMIKEVVGYDGEIEFDLSKPDGTPRKLLDSSHIQALGWESDVGLEQGLRGIYQWFCDNN